MIISVLSWNYNKIDFEYILTSKIFHSNNYNLRVNIFLHVKIKNLKIYKNICMNMNEIITISRGKGGIFFF